ncbi:MAG: hypothetical protein KDD25_04895 [Bdellovibrionales bacterium]|nr:hypothetical protein [Bdellovibrionales bacterium]
MLNDFIDFFTTHSLATVTVTGLVIVGTTLFVWGFREVALWFLKVHSLVQTQKEILRRTTNIESMLKELRNGNSPISSQNLDSQNPNSASRFEIEKAQNEKGFSLDH